MSKPGRFRFSSEPDHHIDERCGHELHPLSAWVTQSGVGNVVRLGLNAAEIAVDLECASVEDGYALRQILSRAVAVRGVCDRQHDD